MVTGILSIAKQQVSDFVQHGNIPRLNTKIHMVHENHFAQLKSDIQKSSTIRIGSRIGHVEELWRICHLEKEFCRGLKNVELMEIMSVLDHSNYTKHLIRFSTVADDQIGPFKELLNRTKYGTNMKLLMSVVEAFYRSPVISTRKAQNLLTMTRQLHAHKASDYFDLFTDPVSRLTDNHGYVTEDLLIRFCNMECLTWLDDYRHPAGAPSTLATIMTAYRNTRRE